MSFSRPKLWLVVGSLLGGLAVALGAFGAHGLERALEENSSLTDAQRAHLIDVWNTAAQYQMYHALALLAVGFVAARRCGLAVNLAGAGFLLGTLIFSGCLYALVLSDQRWLGGIVPIGGSLLIAGWVCLLVAVLREPVAGGAKR